jgi:hypothetical protein
VLPSQAAQGRIRAREECGYTTRDRQDRLDMA